MVGGYFRFELDRGVAAGSRWLAQASALRDFARTSPSPDEVHEGLLDAFTGRGRPKSARLERLTVEVLVDRDALARGGRVGVWLPAVASCGLCGGSGRVWTNACGRCAQSGALVTERLVELVLPPGSPDGSRIERVLRRWGARDLVLSVVARQLA